MSKRSGSLCPDWMSLTARRDELLVEQVGEQLVGHVGRRPGPSTSPVGQEHLGRRRGRRATDSLRRHLARLGALDRDGRRDRRRSRSPPGRSQKPRNSAAQRGSSRIDSANITLTGSIRSCARIALALLGPPLRRRPRALEPPRAHRRRGRRARTPCRPTRAGCARRRCRSSIASSEPQQRIAEAAAAAPGRQVEVAVLHRDHQRVRVLLELVLAARTRSSPAPRR